MIKLIPFANLNLKEINKASLRVWYSDHDYEDLFLDPSKIRQDHFQMPKKEFDKCAFLVLILEYKDGSIQKFRRSDKYEWINGQKPKNIQFYLRKNENSFYDDSDFGKKTVLKILDARFSKIQNCSKETVGTKNLIYYAVGGDLNYLSLLETSINSIVSLTSEKSFEFLFICPESWQSKIKNLDGLRGINYHFHTVDDSTDGVEISKNKTKIYDFDKVNEFAKILFIDSDVIAIKNINEVFDLEIENGKLYTAYSEKIIKLDSHLGQYHGIVKDDAFYKRICENQQMPFNAGQFLFMNCELMKEHFYNVNWLMKSWPSEYFFEQAFMNYYFCNYNLTEYVTFNSKVKIHSAIDQNKSRYNPEIKDSDVLIHFIGPCLEPIAKSNFIKEYSHAYLSR